MDISVDLETLVVEALSRPSPSATDENVRQRAERTTQMIFGCFRDAIESGRIRANDRLPAEREIARMFEAPRGPVRRALKLLEDEGMVKRRVGSGTRVAERSQHALAEKIASGIPVSPQDIIEARLAIEPGFAEFVVARATDVEFARMESWLSQAEQAPDQRHFREAMYRFHLEVARATRNPLLAAIFEIIFAARVRVGWDKLPQLNDTRSSQKIITESSRRIMSAFRDRQTKEARLLLREHFGRLVVEATNLPLAGR